MHMTGRSSTSRCRVNVFYKRFRVKQYLKGGRAMRIETVIYSPRDLRRNARLPNLAELQDKAGAINRRVLDAERAGQGTVLASLGPERAHRHRGQADLEPDLGRRADHRPLRRAQRHQ